MQNLRKVTTYKMKNEHLPSFIDLLQLFNEINLYF